MLFWVFFLSFPDSLIIILDEIIENTRGERGGDNGNKRGRVFRNIYTGHMD